jgi:hypothetical protein
MADTTEPSISPSRPSLTDVLAVVVVVQLLVWSMTACLMDGGVVCGRFSRLLVGYWLLGGMIRLIGGGVAFKWMVAATGWSFPVAYVIWERVG